MDDEDEIRETYGGDLSYRLPPPEAYRPTPVQRQILLFLGTGGPAYIATGSRHTRCGTTTGGDRYISTSSPVVSALLHHKLIISEPGSGRPDNRPYRANMEHPAVARLLRRA